jgi:hypothetical protein
MPKTSLRRFVLALLVTITVSGYFHIPRSGAQRLAPNTVYAVTWNLHNTTTIWEVDLPRREIHDVLTLDYYVSTTLREALSDHELAAFSLGSEYGVFPGKTADDVRLFQSIEGIWLVSPGLLLAEIRHMACDTLPGGDCYGFYEFALVDVTTGAHTDLLHVDYHNAAADEWTGCGSRVYIDTVLPNPSQDKFAFTLKPASDCYPVAAASYGYVVDYSGSSARLTPLPLADGLSWSPDGGLLAYATQDACHDSVCTASIHVLDVSDPSESVILNSTELYHSTSFVTAWSDERTVVYPWQDMGHGDVPPSLVWQDVPGGGMMATTMPGAFSTGVYSLGAERRLVAFSYPAQALIALAAEETPVTRQITPEVDRVFYNSRYNDTLILAANQFQIVTLIDATLGMQDLPLADLFAAYPDEHITYLSPGE